jgi:hypothetical protein
MSNQRLFPRVAVNKKAMISLSDLSGKAAKCTLLDVSAQGVAIKVAADQFSPERGQWLTIHMDTNGQAVEIPGRVRYVASIGSNTNLLGIELDLPSSGASTHKTWSFWVQNLIATVPGAAVHHR